MEFTNPVIFWLNAAQLWPVLSPSATRETIHANARTNNNEYASCLNQAMIPLQPSCRYSSVPTEYHDRRR